MYYYDYIKMSFQDSVIKEIADMTTTKSQLWKFEIVYPLAYKDINCDEHAISTKVVQTTIILDYETFKKGHKTYNGAFAEQDWATLTDSRINTINSEQFDTIHNHIRQASDGTDIIVEDALVTILSKTLLN